MRKSVKPNCITYVQDSLLDLLTHLQWWQCSAVLILVMVFIQEVPGLLAAHYYAGWDSTLKTPTLSMRACFYKASALSYYQAIWKLLSLLTKKCSWVLGWLELCRQLAGSEKATGKRTAQTKIILPAPQAQYALIRVELWIWSIAFTTRQVTLMEGN